MLFLSFLVILFRLLLVLLFHWPVDLLVLYKLSDWLHLDLQVDWSLHDWRVHRLLLDLKAQRLFLTFDDWQVHRLPLVTSPHNICRLDTLY